MKAIYNKGYQKLNPVYMDHRDHRDFRHHALGLDRSKKHDVWRVVMVNRENALQIVAMFEELNSNVA